MSSKMKLVFCRMRYVIEYGSDLVGYRLSSYQMVYSSARSLLTVGLASSIGRACDS